MKQNIKAAAYVLLSILLMVSLCGLTFDTPPEPKLICQWEFSTVGVAGVEAHYAADRITLLESGNGKIVLQEFCSYDDPSYHATSTREGGVIKILGGERPQNRSYESYILLYVPPEFDGSVLLRTASGKVETADTSFAGPVTLRTASGGISVTNPGFALNCHTSSGGIQVSGGSLRGSLSSASGKIAVQASSLGGDLRIETASGKVVLGLPATEPFKLRASTATGKLMDDFGLSLNNDSYPTTNGSNPQNAVEITSASGNIEIQKW